MGATKILSPPFVVAEVGDFAAPREGDFVAPREGDFVAPGKRDSAVTMADSVAADIEAVLMLATGDFVRLAVCLATMRLGLLEKHWHWADGCLESLEEV